MPFITQVTAAQSISPRTEVLSCLIQKRQCIEIVLSILIDLKNAFELNEFRT
jgi:hypothetical protein